MKRIRYPGWHRFVEDTPVQARTANRQSADTGHLHRPCTECGHRTALRGCGCPAKRGCRCAARQRYLSRIP
jgi:hypothetical protein